MLRTILAASAIAAAVSVTVAVGAAARPLMSPKLTWNLPSRSARTFAARVIACAARGDAPTRRNWFTIGIEKMPLGCVASVQRIA